MLGKDSSKEPKKGMTLDQTLQCVLSQDEYRTFSDSSKNTGLKYKLPEKYGATIAQRLEKKDFSIPKIFDEIEYGKTATYKCKNDEGNNIEIDFCKPRRYRDIYKESNWINNKPGSMVYGVEESLIDDYKIQEYKIEDGRRIRTTVLSINPYGKRATASNYVDTQEGEYRINYEFFKDENLKDKYNHTSTHAYFRKYRTRDKSIIIHHDHSLVLFDEMLGANGKYKFDKDGKLSSIGDLYPYEPQD